jgi:hypothetical protein
MKLRHVVLLSTAILFGAVFAQDPNPQVTYSTKAATVDKVVEALAKQTGAKIAASPAISREVVLISVTDVPLETLLSKLADAVSGEWRAGTDGIRYLNYDNSLFQRRSKEANDRRAEILRKDIIEQLKQAAEMEEMMKNPPPAAKGEEGAEGEEGEIGESMDVPEMGFPWTSRDTWVLKVVSRIDPHQLVGIGDARIVFSSNPTRMQRRLPNINDLVAQMIDEHNKVAFEIERNKRENEEEDPRTVEEKAREKQFEELFGGFMQREDAPIRTTPAKSVLIVKRGGMMSMFGATAELILFDTQGKKIYSVSSNIDLGEDSGSFDEIMETVGPMAEGEQQPEKVDTTKPIEFSADTQEMMKLFDMNAMAAMFGGGGPQVSDGLKAKLARPDLHDPLSFGPTDSLLFVAKDRKLNIVAALPDSVTGMADLMFAQGLTVGAFVENLQDNRSLVIETKDGWFTIRPFDPEAAKLFRVDRHALLKLMRAGEAGPPSMDALAEYALGNESPMKTEVVMPYLTLFVPSIFVDMMMGGRGWGALRLYGTLSQTQKDALRRSGSVQFGTLTPQQRGHAETLLFGVETSLQLVDPTKKQDELPDFMKMAGAMFGGGGGGDYRTEPTEVMANGLPSQGVITGLLVEKPILTPAEGMMSKIGFDAGMVAMFQFAMNEPEAAGQMPEFGAMRLGNRTTLELRLIVAPNVEQTERLSTDSPSTDRTLYAIDNLPPVMKAAVEREIEKLKKLGMFGGGGGLN